MKAPKRPHVALLLLLLIAFPARSAMAQCGASAGNQYAYYMSIQFMDALVGDLVKLIPRAMGSYIYQNRYDFTRGYTFMKRNVMSNPFKQIDLEEVRRNTYARLMRDIPYCIQAFEGGDIKLDTSASNLAGRLGMIAYSISLLKVPPTPGLEYLEKVYATVESAIADSQLDVFLYYDGYADFNSLGELMERLQPEGMPTLIHVRNDRYPGTMKEDIFAMFRPPPKFEQALVLTDTDINRIYSSTINSIADVFVFIWKTSCMNLAHPSYAAPPGTVIKRDSRRTSLSAGVLAKPLLPRPREEAVPLEFDETGATGPRIPVTSLEQNQD